MTTSEVRLKAIAESLALLSRDITQGDLPDICILKDLKLTVDQLRLSLWAVIAYERRSTRDSRAGLRSQLAEFRMKRLMEMLGQLQADLVSGVLAATPPELRDLTSALHSTLQNLAPVHKVGT